MHQEVEDKLILLVRAEIGIPICAESTYDNLL